MVNYTYSINATSEFYRYIYCKYIYVLFEFKLLHKRIILGIYINSKYKNLKIVKKYLTNRTLECIIFLHAAVAE